MIKLALFFISAAILTLMILFVAPDNFVKIGIFLTMAAAAVFLISLLFLPWFFAGLFSLFIFLTFLLKVLRVLDLVNGVILVFFMIFLGILMKQLIRR